MIKLKLMQVYKKRV